LDLLARFGVGYALDAAARGAKMNEAAVTPIFMAILVAIWIMAFDS
jgi:hypothetical protein